MISVKLRGGICSGIGAVTCTLSGNTIFVVVHIQQQHNIHPAHDPTKIEKTHNGVMTTGGISVLFSSLSSFFEQTQK